MRVEEGARQWACLALKIIPTLGKISFPSQHGQYMKVVSCALDS